MATLLNPFLRADDANGNPVSGGQLAVFEAGTTTPVTTYSDRALTTAQAQPLIANSAGEFAQSFVASGIYKIRVSDADGVTLYENDNVRIADRPDDPVFFDTEAELLASTDTYAEGTFVVALQENKIFEAAASGATDHNTTNAGGQKLYIRSAAAYENVTEFLAASDTYADDTIVLTRQDGFSYVAVSSGAHVTNAGGQGFTVNPGQSGHFNALAWGCVADGVTDTTTSLQSALDDAHDNNGDLFIPAGIYLVTGLTLPGTVTGSDERSKAFRVFGQGTGEALAITEQGGTIIKSTTNAPVLQDILDTNPSSNGSVRIEYIRFDGTSSTSPVLKLDSFFGLSRLSNLVIRQRGTGDAVNISTTGLTEIDHCFAFNGDYVASGLGASRTGCGWRFTNTWNAALITLRKCSARGFLDGFIFDSVTNGQNYISSRLVDCQVSVCRNGVAILGGNAWTIENLYAEGLDGGTAVLDEGDYTRVVNSFISTGFAVGIDATNTTSNNCVYQNNVISSGNTAGAVLLDLSVGTSARKTVSNNIFITTAATANVVGLKLTGSQYQIDVSGNDFEPRAVWTGSGAERIQDNTTSPRGFVQLERGATISTFLRGGGVTFGTVSVSESDVSSNVLALPPGNYFEMSASSATTVQRVLCDMVDTGRLIIIRLLDSNVTFQNTAFLDLDSTDGNFTGPGTIGIIANRIASNDFAYELFRRSL